MLVRRGFRTDGESDGPRERRVRLYRRIAPHGHSVRFGGHGPGINVIRMLSPPTTIADRSSRSHRSLRRHRNNRDAEYIRARRAFCAGILVLLNAAVSTSGLKCDGNVRTETTCTDLYPDSFRHAVICSVKKTSVTVFEGNWSIYESVEPTGTRAVTVASFEQDFFIPLRSGFLGISEARYGRTELWPSSSFSGLIVCQVGPVIKKICILPLPRLVWSLYRDDTVVLERKPLGPSAFGDAHCRALGTDPASYKFTRTMWGFNGQAIVAASEHVAGRVTFHWSSDVPLEISINSTSMALSIRPLSRDSTACVTCIAGIGDNILSLPVTECRHIKGRSVVAKIERALPIRCSCINQYVFSAVCSTSLMLSVYGLTRMYVHR